MKILIDDGMQVKVGTGIGKYTLYLYNTLNKILQEPDRVDLFQFDKGTSGKQGGRLKYLLHINSKGYHDLCGEYDVVHYTNYAIPFRRNRKTKYAVTIHDLASFLHPQSVPGGYRLYNRLMIGYAIRYADTVLTVSRSAKKEIADKWPRYAHKVHLAYPGMYDEFNSDVRKQDARYALESLKQLKRKQFFLFVGTVEKRKNLAIVIRAFLALKQAGKADGYQLVLAGRPGFGFEEYEALTRDSAFGSDVIFTGYISSRDCAKLYQEAAAYVFPSVYEGFGSTQLECMANHLPLILSRIPTNLEISRDYGLFFDLEDQQSLEAQMLAVMEGRYDTQEKDAVADQICADFTWDHVITSYLEAY